MANKKQKEVRPLWKIAQEIRELWGKNIYFGAKPYLAAMATLDKISDKYLCDSAKTIVSYFLSNANTWKGDDARRIKAELRGMLK